MIKSLQPVAWYTSCGYDNKIIIVEARVVTNFLYVLAQPRPPDILIFIGLNITKMYRNTFKIVLIICMH